MSALHIHRQEPGFNPKSIDHHPPSGMSTKPKRIYICNRDGCGKNFTRLYSLKRHQMCHETVRRFCCEVCNKKFALPQYLKEHSFIHTGQKPFACQFPGCGKQFRQAGKLSIHKKVHRQQLQKSADKAISANCIASVDDKECHQNFTSVYSDSMVIDTVDHQEFSIELRVNTPSRTSSSSPTSSQASTSSSVSTLVHNDRDKLNFSSLANESRIPTISIGHQHESEIFQIEQPKSFIDFRKLPVPEKMMQQLEEDGLFIQRMLDNGCVGGANNVETTTSKQAISTSLLPLHRDSWIPFGFGIDSNAYSKHF